MKRRREEPIIDVLPELYPYRDDGCEVSPSCLSCPLPRCKYDDPGWLQRLRREERDREVIRTRRSEGLTVPQLASRFGVSQRTIFRILRRFGQDGSDTRAE
jgi:AraC-like DNA-binding protein